MWVINHIVFDLFIVVLSSEHFRSHPVGGADDRQALFPCLIAENRQSENILKGNLQVVNLFIIPPFSHLTPTNPQSINPEHDYVCMHV